MSVLPTIRPERWFRCILLSVKPNIRKNLLNATVCLAFAVSARVGSSQDTQTHPQQEEGIPRISTPAIRALEATHYTAYMGMRPLESLAASPVNANKSEIVTVRAVDPHNRVGGASTYEYAWLQELAANADLVVIGRPYERVSDFTPDHSVLFSDYQFNIEEVLKGNSQQYWAGRQIVVTRAGGVLEANGRTFRAIDPEFHLFQTDQRYLLLLHRVPETGTFLVTSQGSFLLQDGLIISAKTHPEHLAISKREVDLVTELRAIVAKTKVQQ
jgi:hypothetical protein